MKLIFNMLGFLIFSLKYEVEELPMRVIMRLGVSDSDTTIPKDSDTVPRDNLN